MNSSSETTNSGGQANRTGNLLESFVENILKQKGYQGFWDHKEQVFANRKVIGGKQYAKQVIIGKSIYDTNVKCDFFIINKEKFADGLVIECKWQQVGGSVDVKYPFNVANIIKIGVPTIILIDGRGYGKKAIEWLKGEAHADRALIGVYNMAEFQTKVNNGLI